MAILSLLLIVYLLIVGFYITYIFRLKLYFEERVFIGGTIATVFFSYITFFVSYIFGLGVVSVLLSLVLISVVVRVLSDVSRSEIKKEWKDFRLRHKTKSWRLFWTFLGIFNIGLGVIAFNLLRYEDGRLLVEVVHGYGDVSLHLTLISSFAFGGNIPPTNPLLFGEKISYPFLVNFFSAIFVNPLGLKLWEAISLSGAFLAILIVNLLGYFGLRILGSKKTAIWAMIIFLFNGGVGFLYFIEDLIRWRGEFLANWSTDYTSLKEIGYWWINVVISMFLPQRSFLLGLPVFILVIYLFWECSKEFEWRKYLLGVLLLGLLPLIHTYSLIALVPFVAWFNLQIIFKKKFKIDYKKLLVVLFFNITALVLAVVLTKIFLGQSDNPFSRMKYQLGWMSGEETVWLYYLKNFGVILIFLPATLILGIYQRLKLAHFVLVAQVWIVLPSLIIFQPWEFDNTKLFIYWYFCSSLLIAYYLVKAIERRWYFLSIVAVFFLILSGLLDVSRLFYSSVIAKLPNTYYEIYSPQAIELAEYVKENTPKDSVFLSMDKFDNPVLSLAGRRTVVGYHGWLWTHGLNYSEREKDVRGFLSGRSGREVLDKYSVDYVIIFDEKNEYEINEDFIRRNSSLVYAKNGYRIYQIKS